jgi:hypothetical protein
MRTAPRGNHLFARIAVLAATAAAACDPHDHKPPQQPPPGEPPQQPPPSPEFCQGDGWCWENPLPQGNAFRAVWMAPAGRVPGADDTFVVGVDGLVFRRHAGDWIIDDSGVSAGLRAVWGSAGNDVWAVGDGGAIVHFDGARWSTVASGTTSHLRSIWGASADDVWIVGAGDTILHRAGGAWVAVPPPTLGTELHGVFGTAANDVWAVGERRLCGGGQSGVVMHWDGNAWMDAFLTEERPEGTGSIVFTTVWASGPGDVWVGGFDILRGAADIFGIMIHFDGTSWAGGGVPSLLFGGRPITSIFGASPTDVWAAPGLHWDGTEWSLVLAERTAHTAGLHGRATDDVVAVGRDGRVIHFNGQSWEDWNTTVTDDPIVDAWGDANGEIFAVTQTLILHYDGRGWSRAFHGPGAPFVAVWGSAPDHVIFLRQDGESMVWDGTGLFNNGFFGTPMTIPGFRFLDVWTPGPGDVWATGFIVGSGPGVDAGRVLRRQGFDPWAEVLATPEALVAISASGLDDIWVGAASSTVYRFDGAAWTPFRLGDDSFRIFDALWSNGPADVWVSGFSAGAVFHWDGTAFTAVPFGDPVRFSSASRFWSDGAANAWAVASDTTVHWDGTAWTESSPDTQFSSWNAIWQTPDGKVRIFGNAGGGGWIMRK